MEQNEIENENSQKLNPNIPMKLSSHAAPAYNSLSSSDPLFSSILTLYILILLYFPHIFFNITISPVLIITSTLLLTLLRFGATQRNQNREKSKSNCTTEAAEKISADSASVLDQDYQWVSCTETGFDSNPCFEDMFVEWNVRAPLEVIHEAYEGNEEGEENVYKDRNNNEKDLDTDSCKDLSRFWIERYASLSSYYPETDSDTSSDGGDFLAIVDRGWPEGVCFKLEDEDREGLIEIALDHGANVNNKRAASLDAENFHGEEENNLIEIDISPVKSEEKWRFSGDS